jgi:UDP-N-acetylmuramyl pentapeptide phosphotransferase/UDP-N-acetylglucosamine-1-phosphate transferase
MYSVSFILSYFIVILMIGVVTINSFRKFILKYRIFGKAKKRDFQQNPIPNSSGVAFFFIFTLGLIILEPFIESSKILGLIVSSFLIIVTGFWDDLKILNPYKKLLYQIISIVFIVVHNDLILQNLHGFLGIEIIPYWIGLIFTSFIGIFMINSFNLIDGIDGLSSFIAIISFLSFAIIFWGIDSKGFFGICFLMVGILAAYIPFNFGSQQTKVFMGDSGSMFIGLILFVMSMIVVNTPAPIIDRLFDRSILPVAPLVIFIIPIIDSASIYLYRLSKGRSPFSADKFHIHHIFLSFTKSHLISSLAISSLLILTIVIFAISAFNFNSLFFISSYFILIFFMIIIVNLLRIYFKKDLNNL